MPATRKNNITLTDEEIREAYFDWLCKKIHLSRHDVEKRNLAKQLSEKPFYWHVPNDDNREADGMHLRETFADEELFADCPCLDGPCSMLEMLVGLAEHMAFTIESGRQNQTPFCFWTMVNNLGLQGFRTGDKHTIQMNNTRLEILINRQYTSTGNGGLFPLKYTRQNQREVELWYQMQSYVGENFDF